MVLHNPPLKPNEPIFLENTTITHIESHCLPTPCLIQVVLHLSPTITCRIESDNFPIQLLKDYQHKTFLVTLKNGCKIRARLPYSFHGLLYTLFYNRSSKDTFKGFLVLYMNPCTVAQSNTLIKSVSFGILNFKSFHGSRDKQTEVNGNHRQLGATEMEYDPWQIDITETPTFSENRKILEQEDGYSVSHTGSIKHSDGETFSVRKAENILRGLRTFLSFAGGSACGLALVKAIDEDDRELVVEWGVSHIEPWSQRTTRSWLPETDGGDSLSQLFPGFWRFYKNPDWGNTVCTVIDWYFNSNNSPAHVGIILAQAALESLSYKILREKLPAKETKKLSAEGKLRKLLEIIEIDKGIPPSCEGLKDFSKQKIRERRDKNSDCYIGDGPEAIVQIRNDLIHPEKKYNPLSAEAQIDAIRLSFWYIELVLLRKFEYCGRYRNHLRNSGENLYEYVPWVKQISN